jgi:5-methylcytosine-specific restriction endonuclease McrA
MPYASTEARRAHVNRRYETDEVFRAKAIARAKRRSRDKINAYRREWRQRPHVRAKENGDQANWRREHPGYQAATSARWRARAKATTIEPVDYAVVRGRANGICGICLEVLAAPIEIDHIIPLARGGTHTYDNLQAAHATCNRRKSARLLGRR